MYLDGLLNYYFSSIMFCFMLDGKGYGSLTTKLDAQFPKQVIMDAMGIVYP